MASLITVRIDKGSSSNLGFRLQGGKDFGTPLVIQKVRNNFIKLRPLFINILPLPMSIELQQIVLLLFILEHCLVIFAIKIVDGKILQIY